MRHAVVATLATLAIVMSACASEPQGSHTDPDQVDAVEAPEEGACRVLTPSDAAKPVNATKTVACGERHTAETFSVTELPEDFEDAAHDDPSVGEYAHRHCSTRFRKFLGADASQALRTTLSWAWFRPSRSAWAEGARWIRCDVLGGHMESDSLTALPGTAEGLLSGRPKDRWLVCARGQSFASATKVPCSEGHNWRAVTTIKVGEPEDAYPGDAEVAERSDDFCESSVHAWLNYPADYEFAITWFGQEQWETGNRLSVCWAGTTE